MRIRGQYIGVLCVVLITGLFILFYKPVFMELVVEPFAHIIWLILRIIGAIHQKTLWWSLVTFIFIVSFQIIPQNNEERINKGYQNHTQRENRVEYWRELFKAADNDLDCYVRLQKNIRDLGEPLCEIYGVDDQEVFLLSTLQPNFLRKARKNLSRFLAVVKIRSSSKLLMDSNIESVLNAMESLVEDKNGCISTHYKND